MSLGLIVERLRALYGTSTGLSGLAADLAVTDETGWHPADDLAGPLFDDLLTAAIRHWDARPPAAAALAWKAYTYWVCLPFVIAWVSARGVPLLTGTNVLVRLDRPRALVTVGLRAGLPDAAAPEEAVRALLGDHLTPLLEKIHAEVRVGKRPLLGTLAANVAGVALRCADAARTEQLLTALGVDGLVDLVPEVRRRTCCLAFTLPRPKVCQDCCLGPVQVPGGSAP